MIDNITGSRLKMEMEDGREQDKEMKSGDGRRRGEPWK
jgi:hypothetical protein